MVAHYERVGRVACLGHLKLDAASGAHHRQRGAHALRVLVLAVIFGRKSHNVILSIWRNDTG